jgi:hypothetical protein
MDSPRPGTCRYSSPDHVLARPGSQVERGRCSPHVEPAHRSCPSGPSFVLSHNSPPAHVPPASRAPATGPRAVRSVRGQPRSLSGEGRRTSHMEMWRPRTPALRPGPQPLASRHARTLIARRAPAPAQAGPGPRPRRAHADVDGAPGAEVFRTGEELEMVQWCRAGDEVGTGPCWTSQHVHEAHTIPTGKVRVLKVLKTRNGGVRCETSGLFAPHTGDEPREQAGDGAPAVSRTPRCRVRYRSPTAPRPHPP